MRTLFGLAILLASTSFYIWLNWLIDRSPQKVALPQVVILADQHSKNAVEKLREAIVAKQGVRKDAVVVLEVSPLFSLESNEVRDLRSIAPEIVISPNEKYMRVLRAGGIGARGIVLTHGPWVDPNYDTGGAWLGSGDTIISTYLNADIPCIEWLTIAAPLAKKIGILGYAETNREHVTQLQQQFANSHVQLMPQFSSGLDESLSIIANSRALGIDAWYLPHSPAIWRDSRRVANALKLQGLASAFEYSHKYVERGGLLGCATEFDMLNATAEAVQLLLLSPGAMRQSEYRPTLLTISYNVDTGRHLGLSLGTAEAQRVDFWYGSR